MTERTRQSIGGLLLAAVLLVVGLLLRPAAGVVGGVMIFGGAVTGIVLVVSVALDLIRGERVSD